jgi:hypothetical protein
VRQRPAKPCTRVRLPSPPPLLRTRARLAQRESASLTRKRSLVQSQYRALRLTCYFKVWNQASCPICAQSDGHDLRVRPSAIQFADGRIDDGHIERPAIHVDDCDRTLTAAQARELAAVLLAAAEEVDGWARNADYAWADPAWHVYSETRTCSSGIGGHTQECRPVSIDASRLR